MKFKKLHPGFQLPVRGSEAAGGIDIFMPSAGQVTQTPVPFPLGFAAAVPQGHIGLILPRSSVGAKKGLEVTNTTGVIDSDYRGEWIAYLNLKPGFEPLNFTQDERLLQIVVVPVVDLVPQLVDELSNTARGDGGFGSTGQ